MQSISQRSDANSSSTPHKFDSLLRSLHNCPIDRGQVPALKNDFKERLYICEIGEVRKTL